METNGNKKLRKRRKDCTVEIEKYIKILEAKGGAGETSENETGSNTITNHSNTSTSNEYDFVILLIKDIEEKYNNCKKQINQLKKELTDLKEKKVTSLPNETEEKHQLLTKKLRTLNRKLEDIYIEKGQDEDGYNKLIERKQNLSLSIDTTLKEINVQIPSRSKECQKQQRTS